jgi:serine/arginine repetitive matrix protein 2
MSSPTKRTFQLDLGNTLSPQKLKVTVEAGSDTENSYQYDDDVHFGSPSRIVQPLSHRVERTTTTTTVPLRGLSDSEGENRTTTPKRSRGRPRKSGTPLPSRQLQHSVTPTHKNRRRRKSIGEQVYGDSENDADYRIGKNVEVKRRRGRKSIGEQVYGESENDADFQAGKDVEPKRRKGRKSIGELVYGDSENDADFQVGRSLDGKRGKGRPRKPRPSEVWDSPILSTAGDMAKGKRTSLDLDEIVVHEDGDSAGVVGSASSDPSDALSPIDSNAAYSPSKYSTIRPTATNDAEDEPDATLAKFHLGSETPRNIGWPIPRVVESSQLRSSDRQKDSYPSPSSLEKAQNQGRGVVDELEEAPEFDTILEGEEFSMISVDSVPSLRRHLSSPPGQIQQRDTSGLFVEQSTSIVQEVEGDEYKPSSTLSIRNAEKVASQFKPKNRSLLSVQNLESEDSFSSIPSEILEAATPGRDLATPAVSEPNGAQGESYDDSFSAIPSTILDGATPTPLRQTLLKPGNASEGGIASSKLSATASIQSASSALRGGHGPATARLLTPEETPSPGELSNSQNTTSGSKLREIISYEVATEQVPENESYISTQMKSSPPPIASHLHAYTDRLLVEPQLQLQTTQTPAITFSSPTLPPPIQLEKDNPFLVSSSEQEKPPLSPAARAGRMLQDLVVPSSPRSRSESLGSPFKSPIAERKSSSIANGINTPSQPREASPAKPGINEDQFPRESQGNRSIHNDDPFLNSIPSPSENIFTSQGSERPQLSDPRVSHIRSEGDSLQSADYMSWQAEDVLAINQDSATNANYINSGSRTGAQLQSDAVNQPGSAGYKTASAWKEKWAADRASVSRDIEDPDASKVIVIDSEDGDNEGEDFGLLLETLNSSSPAPTTHYQRSGSLDNLNKQRRSLGPLDANSQRSTYSDELSHLSSPMHTRISLAGNGTNTGINRDATNADPSSSSGTRTYNFNPRARERGPQDVFALLAASPNKLPPVLPQNSEDSSLAPQSSPNRPLSMDAASPIKGNEPQQYFRQIPQKLDFKPRIRDPDSSFGSSPVRQPSYGIFGAQLGKGRLSSASTRPSFAPRPQVASSPGERNIFPTREAQTSSAHLSSPVAISNSKPSPGLDEEQESLAADRTKEWTESVRLASTEMQGLASPTKSCLRSPLKTPTGAPGSRNSSSSAKTVAFVSSSPIPSSPMEEVLSSTIWSRDHWILLDGILQNWKPENQVQDETRRRNSTRVISRLLGKNVRSGNDKIKLEQWHLEVVDEFRGCVPGWKEETIAMRVFALIIGERDRALGLVGSNRRDGEVSM